MVCLNYEILLLSGFNMPKLHFKPLRSTIIEHFDNQKTSTSMKHLATTFVDACHFAETLTSTTPQLLILKCSLYLISLLHTTTDKNEESSCVLINTRVTILELKKKSKKNACQLYLIKDARRNQPHPYRDHVIAACIRCVDLLLCETEIVLLS